jgi:addiction module HigA family antidote
MTTQEEEKLAPVHPGDVLLHDFMAPLGLSAYRVAKDIGVAPIVISEIVRHKRAVTAKTALLLAKYLGTSPDLWLALQTDYDLEAAAPQYRSLVDAVKKVRHNSRTISAAELAEHFPQTHATRVRTFKSVRVRKHPLIKSPPSRQRVGTTKRTNTTE